MRYGLLILLLLIPINAFAQGPSSITLTVSSAQNAAEFYVTLTATVPSGSVPSVSFFYGTVSGNYTNFIGALTSPTSSASGTDTYTYVWHNVLNGTYYFEAIPGNVSAGTTTNTIKIDTVGSPAATPNPVTDPTLGQTFGEGGTGSWLPGDNQMCFIDTPSATDPNAALHQYNAGSNYFPDGSCEWFNGVINNSNIPASFSANPSMSTVDSLDDVMHTLSDFSTFSESIINLNLGSLNSTFDTWYPQAANWIAPACNPACTVCTDPTDTSCTQSCPDTACNAGNAGVPGRLLSIYEPTNYPNIAGVSSTGSAITGYAVPTGQPYIVDVLHDWNNVITSWLNNVYPSTDASNNPAWCVPLESTISGTNEDVFIKNNSAPGSSWGDISHVVACLNYNGNQALNNYQACLNYLSANINSCPASLSGTACDPSTLGRSLGGANPGWDNNCDPASGSFAGWVQSSVGLFTNENKKFTLRYEFLNDVYTRAKNMQNISAAGDLALQNFLKPCNDATCTQGGPAAQLMYARSHEGAPTSALPNSVIYGWTDNPPTTIGGGCLNSSGQRVGCSHLVEATVYSPARQGSVSWIQSLLPWVRTYNSGFLGMTKNYELTNRDGDVYVSVKRWDQDHSTPVLFPNGRTLWQFMFHNPNPSLAFTPSGNSPFATNCVNSVTHYGLGIQALSAQGLDFNNVPSSAGDYPALQNAFMLNGWGSDTADPNYPLCLSVVKPLLAQGVESHACVKYVASLHPNCQANNPASCSSGTGDNDYSLEFEDCNAVDGGTPPPDSF